MHLVCLNRGLFSFFEFSLVAWTQSDVPNIKKGLIHNSAISNHTVCRLNKKGLENGKKISCVLY